MFRPTFCFERVTDLTPSFLLQQDIRCLLLDVDNTLTTHHGQRPLPGLDEWIIAMKQAGIALYLVSNSTPHRLAPFSETVGLPFVAASLKPLPFGYLRALHRLGVRKRHALAVGDQLFTDVAGANCFGLKSCLTVPIKPETSRRFRFKRRLEARIIKKKGIR